MDPKAHQSAHQVERASGLESIGLEAKSSAARVRNFSVWSIIRLASHGEVKEELFRDKDLC